MPRTSVPIVTRPHPAQPDPLAPFRAMLADASARLASPRIVYDGTLNDPEGYLLGSCYGAAECGIAFRSLLRAAGAWADVDPDEFSVDDDASTISLHGTPVGTFRIVPHVERSFGRVA